MTAPVPRDRSGFLYARIGLDRCEELTRAVASLAGFGVLALAFAGCGDANSFANDLPDSGFAETSSPPDLASTPERDAGLEPLAVEDAFFARQDELRVLTVNDGPLDNDSDPDGDALRIVNVDATSAAGGIVDLVDDATIEYAPPSAFVGADVFGYTISDGVHSSTASVTMHVTPTLIRASSISNGVRGFVIDGFREDALTGTSVAGLGDVDGNGVPDLAIESGDVGYVTTRESFVVQARRPLRDLELSAVAEGSGGFVLPLATHGDPAEGLLDAAGDVDADGIDDIVAPAWVDFCWGLCVLFGDPEGPRWPPAADAGGFFISGGQRGHAAGDVNGDGHGDLVVDSYGIIYVIFGKTDTEPVVLGTWPPDQFGFSIIGGRFARGAGDVNGDGLDDVLVGGFHPHVDVVFGKPDHVSVNTDAVASGEGGFRVRSSWGLHIVFDGAGDVNGDGRSDVIVGVGATSELSRAYIVFGGADATTVDLDDLDELHLGFEIDGEAFYDHAASSVDGAGDVNGDGLDDVVIGAFTAGPENSGRAYVVYGTSGFESVRLSDVAAGIGGFAVEGETRGDRFGYSVAGAGDLDGDGLHDVLIGAPRASAEAHRSGRSYLVFGVLAQ